jgi:uncharacterized pyridoxal phosphate-containing UPF0001 family protein
VVDLIHGIRAADVRANLERVKQRIADIGRNPDDVQVLVAVKYLPSAELAALAQAGVTLVGENRAQDLVTKAAEHPGAFTWDFVGALQSRKVPLLLPRVRYIQTVASDSALQQLARHGRPEHRILIEVNVAGETGKAGIEPAALGSFLERCPVTVAGLMTMPPLAAAPEANRRHFSALRELAERHDLRELSMGTSQDYEVAVGEGATIIRLGSTLLRPSAP